MFKINRSIATLTIAAALTAGLTVTAAPANAANATQNPKICGTTKQFFDRESLTVKGPQIKAFTAMLKAYTPQCQPIILVDTLNNYRPIVDFNDPTYSGPTASVVLNRLTVTEVINLIKKYRKLPTTK
jgi:hypothetical protein